MMWMCIMANDIFKCDISSDIISAPPRICLEMFGGSMNIEEYRSKSQMVHTDILESPMVSHFMVLREDGQGDGHTSASLNGIKRPNVKETPTTTTTCEEQHSTQGEYIAFIKNKEKGQGPNPPQGPVAFSKNGTLMEFITPGEVA